MNELGNTVATKLTADLKSVASGQGKVVIMDGSVPF